MNTVTSQDINNFISNERLEDKSIEFKSAIVFEGNKKFDIRRDVCAFANSDGGHIIYGIEAKQGKATKLIGIADSIPLDDIKLRIQQILDTNIEPKLMSFQIYTTNKCLIIEINKSWNAPHAVKIAQNRFEFPYRTDSGNAYYDINTLRDKIMQFQRLNLEINDFVERRISEIHDDYPMTIMHIVPISTFYNLSAIDIDHIYKQNYPQFDDLRPLDIDQSTVPEGLLNLDGIQTHNPNPRQRTQLQLFRNARFELRMNLNLHESVEGKNIRAEWLQKKLIDGFDSCMKFYKKHKIYGPVIIFVNLLNINGIGVDLPPHDDIKPVINPNHRLNLGNIEVSANKTNDALEPLFKIFYNAFGRVKPSNTKTTAS